MMIDKMHTAMNKACEKANEITGVTIIFPKPSKRSLKISVFTNGLVGVGFILFGVLTPYKWTILLGALGLTSSILINQKACTPCNRKFRLSRRAIDSYYDF